MRLHRDWGDRGNRRHARLKYVIAERGEDWARERLSEDLGKNLAPCRPMPDLIVPDHFGWHEQGDGKLYLGLPIASGRIVDGDGVRLRTALREIVARFPCDPILMPSQDVILSEIDPANRDAITAVLRAHGVRLPEELLPIEPLGLGLPGIAELRPGAGRSRARARGYHRFHRRSAAALGPRTGAAQRPHHRLPERMRPAL